MFPAISSSEAKQGCTSYHNGHLWFLTSTIYEYGFTPLHRFWLSHRTQSFWRSKEFNSTVARVKLFYVARSKKGFSRDMIFCEGSCKLSHAAQPASDAAISRLV